MAVFVADGILGQARVSRMTHSLFLAKLLRWYTFKLIYFS